MGTRPPRPRQRASPNEPRHAQDHTEIIIDVNPVSSGIVKFTGAPLRLPRRPLILVFLLHLGTLFCLSYQRFLLWLLYYCV
ncbi:nudix (nucleoside diphosphate linked moiety X)-type motif 11 [Mus musculus]|nr:nudix (nucleoside diphosphate linked moiety X)-type motif 11 [Mus musculus]